MRNLNALPGVLTDRLQGTETIYTAKKLKDFPLTTGTGTFVPASNAFGFRLLSALTGGRSAAAGMTNVFLSPLSLSLALTMTMDGAGGQTRQQMQAAMGYGAGDAPGQIDADAQAFLARYQSGQISPDVAANIASALWSNTSLPNDQGRLDPAFAAHAARTFGAPVEAVNFASASGARRVNAWTRDRTRGKIAAILPDRPLGVATALVLTNAVYFKAKWNHTFWPAITKPDAFTLVTGRKKTLAVMQQTDHYDYLKGDGFQALRLPYDDGRFSLYLLLPERGNPLGAFAAKSLASAAQWNSYPAHFAPTKVALQLPRFKVAYDAGELLPTLSALGMGLATGPHADFRPMGFKGASIGSVRHMTTLVVDESGSEATAVTAVAMRVGTMAMPAPETIVPFVVDRPFGCAIRDNATGALLFLGLIADPEAG